MREPARLLRDLAEPAPIPKAGVARALELLRSGRLFRYGETGGESSDVALLEEEFAALLGRRYCVAVNSGGCALFLLLKLAGVRPGDPVLLNGFTLAPVPGAILHAAARPVLVETGPDLAIDPDDLRRKARASGAAVLVLSHMRGHLADMDAVGAIAAECGLGLIEDGAHALGASWAGRPIGTFGLGAAFSAQGYKHLNAGEGGFLVLDDAELAARAILHAGSYALHAQHRSAPGAEAFAAVFDAVPNFSLRMSALAAALLRPQLAELPARVARWRAIHDRIAAGLSLSPAIRLPERHPRAEPAPTSVQFSLPGFAPGEIARVVERAGARGVPVKWFGAERPAGFTSAPRHWAFAGGDALPATHARLAGLCDVRTPLGLTDGECDLVAAILRDAANGVAAERATERKGGRAAARAAS